MNTVNYDKELADEITTVANKVTCDTVTKFDIFCAANTTDVVTTTGKAATDEANDLMFDK